MKGDFSRHTFDPAEHYSGVRHQQGRVTLDADLNEAEDVARYRTETETVDVVGAAGTPKGTPGFGVVPAGAGFTVGAGRYYVGGRLAENDATVAYEAQPYGPVTPLPGALGDAAFGLVYLDVWDRLVTALDDPRLREVALGGPDTAARTQTVWQARVLPLPSASADAPPACDTAFPEWAVLTAPRTATLAARTTPTAEETPCDVAPGGGFRRVENQLYRVEIHRGGPRATATFKWSRENGSVVAAVERVDGRNVFVRDTGRDEALGFVDGGWVELTDDAAEFGAGRGTLVPVLTVVRDGGVLALGADPPALGAGAKTRRWEQAGPGLEDGVPLGADWVALEDGVEVRFGEGDYRPGDHWLIPARTATGDVEWPPFGGAPDAEPEAVAPHGDAHRYAPLALVRREAEGVTVVGDCRALFPPLTNIDAIDVGFDDENCDLGGAETVQDAIDRLCERTDLRFHNKHLHGWGIVCGLQVECGADGDRTAVTVRPGYAIDCEGRDVRLGDPLPVDVMGLVANLPLAPNGPPVLDDQGNGEVALVLNDLGDERGPFRLEPYRPPQDRMRALLDGTLVMEFVNGCVRPLLSAIRGELDGGPDDGSGDPSALVSERQKRTASLLNLAAPLMSPNHGRFAYLSRAEHERLRAVYDRLRALLQSKTYCAMFDGARPYPDYPRLADPEPTTLYGKGLHRRLRLHPDGETAFTVGRGDRVHVYSLAKGEMTAEVAFPTAGATVHDVAASADGKEVYAVASLAGSPNALFATGRLRRGTLEFGAPTVICAGQAVTLAVDPQRPNTVHVVLKNRGVVTVDPRKVEPNVPLRHAFNATGPAVLVPEEGVLYAAGRGDATASDQYDRVFRVPLGEGGEPQPIPLGDAAPLVGEDDLAAVRVGERGTAVFAVVNDPKGATKRLVGVGSAFANRRAAIDLGENTGIALAAHPTEAALLVAYEDSFRVGVVDVEKGALVEGLRHPVGLGPSAIAATRERVVVLNALTSTLTDASLALLTPRRAVNVEALAAYRKSAFEAMTDLFAGTLQYLKDCFCDRLLVACPECDGDELLYLAVVSIRGRRVERVCNFALRRYVKSFPTVERWLSLVPVLPLVKEAVVRFCCAALPERFGRIAAPEPAANARFKARTAYAAADRAGGFDAGALFRSMGGSLDVVRKLTTDGLFAKRAEAAPTVRGSDVAGQPTTDARDRLERERIVVERVERYDPAKATANLRRVARTAGGIGAGERVVLYEEDGVVRYVAPAEPDAAEVRELRTEVRTAVEGFRAEADRTGAAVAEVETLRASLTALQGQHAALLDRHTAREAEVETLRTRLDTATADLARVTARDAEITTLRTTVDALRRADAERTAELTRFQSRFDDLARRIR